MNFMGHNFQAVASNWIAVSRDVRDHHLVGFGQQVKPANPKKGAFSRAEAWLDLIMLARWRDGPEMNKGRKVDMLAGQLQGGYSFLADRWNWTVQTVRTFIGKLVGERMIDRAEDASESNKRNNNQIQVLTVCNYKKYQLMNELMDMQDQQASNKRATSEQQHLNKDTLIQEDLSPIGDSSFAAQIDPVPAPATKRKKPIPEADLFPDPPAEAPPARRMMTATEAAKEGFRMWNDLAGRCGLPKAEKLTPKRMMALGARMRDAGSVQKFGEIIARIEHIGWMRGDNDRGWRADLDFVCQQSSFVKLMEGAYDRGEKFSAQPERSGGRRTQEDIDNSYLERLARKHLGEAA